MEQYFIKRSKLGEILSVAHIWDGEDTVCRMWSTGGLRGKKYKVENEVPSDTYVCELCEQIQDGRREPIEKPSMFEKEKATKGYLINKDYRGNSTSVAHVWEGNDTVCEMWSTGGIKSRRYRVYEELPDDTRLCQVCQMVQADPTGQYVPPRFNSKQLVFKALATIIYMLCEINYGWKDGEGTEENRKKLIKELKDAAWNPKILNGR
jgi:hypothetical protein